MNDLRSAVRLLTRNVGSTFGIVTLLALGIGACMLVFDLFDAVLLKPLDSPHPEQLVRIVQIIPRIGPVSSLPLAYYYALQSRSTTLADVFGETGAYSHYSLTDPGPPHPISVRAVTPGFFAALGVPAFLGRTLNSTDNTANEEPPPAVLGYDFWQKDFGGERDVLGHLLGISGHKFIIVGVMPRSFHGFTVDTSSDVRIPLSSYSLLERLSPDQLSFELGARLKPGVSLQKAASEALTIWSSEMGDYYSNVLKESPQTVSVLVKRGVSLQSLKRGESILRERFGKILELVMSATVVLLLVDCVNIAGLQFMRTIRRQHEMAIKQVLGATKLLIVRELLVESALLTVLGALGGLIFTRLAAPLLFHLLPPIRDLSTSLVPIAIDLNMNWRIYLFSCSLLVVVLILVGLLPAVIMSDTQLDKFLRGSRFTSTSTWHKASIVSQTALCTFLLFGAALLVESFRTLHGTDPGFDVRRVATFTADMGSAGYDPNSEEALLRTLRERTMQMTDVESVAFASRGVLRGKGLGATVMPAGQRATRGDFLNVSENIVSTAYFTTLGIPLVTGRTFSDTDDSVERDFGDVHDSTAMPVKAVVNEAFATRFFPNENPIGKYFGSGLESTVGPEFQIIGVVGNAKYRSLREPVPPTFYILGKSFGLVVMYVRTRSADPSAIIRPVRDLFALLDPKDSFLETDTLADEVRLSTASEKTLAIISTVFGSLALLLTGAGIYTSFSYSVAQRRQEIGIRMALGEHTLIICERILRRALATASGGLLIGFGMFFLAEKPIEPFFYHIEPQKQALILIEVAAFILIMSALSAALPAARVTKFDQSQVLRCDN
ncbi:MAG: ABC transporter permease [Candidatus Acidiferrales bacterium]